VLGLFLLLCGCLLLLWPWYNHLLTFIHIPRSGTWFYGGLLLMAGVASLFVARVRAR
jgi:hypothetical protein